MDIPEYMKLLKDLQHQHAYCKNGAQVKPLFIHLIEGLEIDIKLCNYQVVQELIFKIAMSEKARETFMIQISLNKGCIDAYLLSCVAF